MKPESEKIIIDDRFKIIDVNNDGKDKYFKNVSRITLKSEYDIVIELDVNTSIYPVQKGQEFLLLISKKIGDKSIYVPDDLAKPSERDNYEYVMYGSVFEIEKQKDTDKIGVFASFGGLLMKVLGKQATMLQFRKDATESKIYIMLKKV